VRKIQNVVNAIQKHNTEFTIAGLAVIFSKAGMKSCLWVFAATAGAYLVHRNKLLKKLGI
jgi:hypothetical protein